MKFVVLAALIAAYGQAAAIETEPVNMADAKVSAALQPMDVFKLEWASAPAFSPDGKRIIFVSNGLNVMKDARRSALWIMDRSGDNLQPSPDGKSLAFSMRVAAAIAKAAELPTLPEGAEWAKPVSVIDRLTYRADGEGIFASYFTHVFLVPTLGGTPRQVTTGDFNYGGFAFADNNTLLVSGNREADAEYQPLQTDLFELNLSSGAICLSPAAVAAAC